MTYVDIKYNRCDACGTLMKAGEGAYGPTSNQDFCENCVGNRMLCASCGDGFFLPDELTDGYLCKTCAPAPGYPSDGADIKRRTVKDVILESYPNEFVLNTDL